MKIDRFANDEYWTVESPADLRNWTILYREPWKDGVARLHCCSKASAPLEFRMIYCATAILNEWDLQETEVV